MIVAYGPTDDPLESLEKEQPELASVPPHQANDSLQGWMTLLLTLFMDPATTHPSLPRGDIYTKHLETKETILAKHVKRVPRELRGLVRAHALHLFLESSLHPRSSERLKHGIQVGSEDQKLGGFEQQHP